MSSANMWDYLTTHKMVYVFIQGCPFCALSSFLLMY
jgi:hypothetical protein